MLRGLGGRGAASASADALNLAEATGLGAEAFVTADRQILRAFGGTSVMPGTRVPVGVSRDLRSEAELPALRVAWQREVEGGGGVEERTDGGGLGSRRGGREVHGDRRGADAHATG